MIWSQLPKRLLRFEISEACNYDCVFCCWRGNQPILNHKIKHNAHFFESKEYRLLLEAAIETGCTRAMLTGGEPFLLPSEQLLRIVSNLTSAKGLSDFWITTNGSFLSTELCLQLVNAGLKKIVISIAAADNQAYKLYTKQNRWNLDKVFSNISECAKLGLHVKVDVPMFSTNSTGISTYQELLKLIDSVKRLGVSEVAYFPIHETFENSQVFNALFVDTQAVTNAFQHSTRWRLKINSRGQTIFTDRDGKIDVIIPAKPTPIKNSCKRLNCGNWCQGAYAAYVIFDVERLYIRACHRTFGKGRNEFEVDRTRLNDHNYLVEVFKSVWSFAYN